MRPDLREHRAQSLESKFFLESCSMSAAANSTKRTYRLVATATLRIMHAGLATRRMVDISAPSDVYNYPPSRALGTPPQYARNTGRHRLAWRSCSRIPHAARDPCATVEMVKCPEFRGAVFAPEIPVKCCGFCARTSATYCVRPASRAMFRMGGGARIRLLRVTRTSLRGWRASRGPSSWSMCCREERGRAFRVGPPPEPGFGWRRGTHSFGRNPGGDVRAVTRGGSG